MKKRTVNEPLKLNPFICIFITILAFAGLTRCLYNYFIPDEYAIQERYEIREDNCTVSTTVDSMTIEDDSEINTYNGETIVIAGLTSLLIVLVIWAIVFSVDDLVKMRGKNHNNENYQS